jgi:hypothetical protein
VNDTIDSALAPCGNCYPVCHCGDESGVCGNEPGGCCSSSSSSPPEEKQDQRTEVSSCCGGGGVEKKKQKQQEIEEVEENDGSSTLLGVGLPILNTTPSTIKPKQGCCASKSADIPPTSHSSSFDYTPSSKNNQEGEKDCGNCCASTGEGCCSGVVMGVDEEKRSGPVKIRNGGLGVVVCGPDGMMVRRLLPLSLPSLFSFSVFFLVRLS